MAFRKTELLDQGGLPKGSRRADLPAAAGSVKVFRIEWDLEITAVLSPILAG